MSSSSSPPALLLALLFLLCLVVTLHSSRSSSSSSQHDRDDDHERVHLVLATDNHGFYRDEAWALTSHNLGNETPADYADLVTLIDRTKEAYPGMSFAVENGDVVDGGGLADKVTRRYERGELFFPILNEIGFDARTLGNHELYSAAALDSLKKYATLDANYVSSNVLWRNETLGRRYRSFPLRTGGDLLVLGFLYEMTAEEATRGAVVEKVHEVVEREWFANAVSNPDVRAVVVLSHMGHDNALLGVILGAIREKYSRTSLPVAFVTGHTHVRAFKSMDPFAVSFECGKYFDTIGLLSFRLQPIHSAGGLRGDWNPDFRHTYLDTTKRALFGVFPDKPPVDTPRAVQVRSLFGAAYAHLGLSRAVGHSPTRYRVALGPTEPDSLWRLYLERVVPDIVFHTIAREQRRGKSSSPQPLLFFTNTGSLRYDIFPGPITVDDVYHVAPFTERFAYFENVLGSHALALFSSQGKRLNLRKAPGDVAQALPRTLHVPLDLSEVVPAVRYTLVCDGFDASEVEKALAAIRARDDDDATPTTTLFARFLTLHDAWVEFFTLYMNRPRLEGVVESVVS